MHRAQAHRRRGTGSQHHWLAKIRAWGASTSLSSSSWAPTVRPITPATHRKVATWRTRCTRDQGLLFIVSSLVKHRQQDGNLTVLIYCPFSRGGCRKSGQYASAALYSFLNAAYLGMSCFPGAAKKRAAA